MLRSPFLYLLTCVLIVNNSFSQTRLGVSSGLSIDVNNQGKFKQLPLSLQWMAGKSKKTSFIVKADIAMPFDNKSYDSAYTLNSGLPPAAAIQKSIKNTWFSFSAGFRFWIHAGSGKNPLFIDLLPVGMGRQVFKVEYKNYNHTDYEVINPDVNTSKTGFLCAMGAGYVINNFVVQAHIQTPLLTTTDKYKLSYKLNAPLQLTIGYLFNLSKTRK